MILLSICIPTVVGREFSFEILHQNILNQIAINFASEKVEVIIEKDNKEISIGAKRQKMLDRCKGLYNVQIDDDDMIAPDYIETVLRALETCGDKYPDCIGYIERCVFTDRVERSSISMKHTQWATRNKVIDNIKHLRTPFCKTPIRTSICKKVGYKDLRFAEDHEFAKAVYPFLESEIYLEKEMYIYQYKHEEHSKKYGIK